MPQQGDNCPHTTTSQHQKCFEEIHFHCKRACQHVTLCSQACSCDSSTGNLLPWAPTVLGANTFWVAQRPWSDCTPRKHRLPSSSNKMVGNTQGVQQTPFLSSAAASSCCSKSNFYPITVKPYLGPFFQYIINQQGLSHTSLPFKKQLCCNFPHQPWPEWSLPKTTPITT